MTKSDKYYPDPPMDKDNMRRKAKKEKTQNCMTKALSVSRSPWRTLLEEIAKGCAYRRWGSYILDHDLLAEGRKHSRALFVTAEVGGWKVPCVMIDDGAYDDSKRNVIGVSRLWLRWGL
ncbi:hypothetical protein GH714_014272 [Hevea brasiliensis]|uniref:Uncharacterized protein n=1 Tax=Hevea brasiliensis TaxID=3981 RepID=A0A6A6NCK8_HEVBR|nr:hypothetical protein GH714_014272 [Hevea brasiliensis]